MLAVSLLLPPPVQVSAQPLPAAVEAAMQAQQATIARLETGARRQAAVVQAQQATIDRLEAKTDELQAALHNLQTESRSLKATLHNVNNNDAPSASPHRQRRSLDTTPTTCNATASHSTEPRLSVEGVCSCTEDVVAAGHSVVDHFHHLNNTSLHSLQQQQQANSALLVNSRSDTN